MIGAHISYLATGRPNSVGRSEPGRAPVAGAGEVDFVDIAPVDPNAALLERLGRVVVRWASIERQLGDLAARLLRAERGPYFVVAGETPTDTQLRWIRFLVEGGFRDRSDREAILKLISTVEALGHRVEDLAAGVWLPGPSGSECHVESVRFGRPEPLQRDLVGVADLDSLARRLQEASSELDTLLHALRRHPTGPATAASTPGRGGGGASGRVVPSRSARLRRP